VLRTLCGRLLYPRTTKDVQALCAGKCDSAVSGGAHVNFRSVPCPAQPAPLASRRINEWIQNSQCDLTAPDGK